MYAIRSYYANGCAEILKLTRPDIVRPEEAVFADVFVTDTNIVLKWHRITSYNVCYTKLLRRSIWKCK